MAAMQDWKVTVIHNGRVHELLAAGTSPAAALKSALRERRTLREAVRDGRAGYEVETMKATMRGVRS